MKPVGPAISTGEVSDMYLGQNTLNDPHARPYTNLPIIRIINDVVVEEVI